MTKAMPFLQKAILLSYDPRRFFRICYFFTLSNRIWQAGQPCAMVSPNVNSNASNEAPTALSPSMAISHNSAISSGSRPIFCHSATYGQ